MFCNELVSDAADDGAAVPSASFSENEVVKLAKRLRLFKDISTGTFFFLTRQFVAAVVEGARASGPLSADLSSESPLTRTL